MADDGTIIITCSCGQRMKAPVQAVGKTASCVKCGEKIKIEAPEGQGAPEQAAKDTEVEPGSEKKEKKGPAVAPGASVVQILKDNGLVDDAAIAEADLLRQDLPLADWEALIECGRVSQDDFLGVMSGAGAARLDLSNYNIPLEVVDYVPAELVKKGRLFPVDKLGKMLTIAMACPLDTATIDEVAQATGFKIKTMLASLDELRKVIDYYYPVIRGQAAYDDAFTKELDKEFKEIAGANQVCASVFDAVPPLPFKATVDKLQAMGGEPLEAIREAVAEDPATSMLVLNVANSAAYGFPRRVDNLAMAAAVMGGPALIAAVRGGPSEDYFAKNGGFDHRAFWKRSLVCAKAAQAVAITQKSQRILTVYTAGLLHGIGRLAMLNVLPNCYAKLTAGLTGHELLEKEERLFRVSHPEIGYMVARKLNLPPGITEPLRHHRQFENAVKSTEVTAAVALGAVVADAIEEGREPDLDQETALLEKLNLTPAQVSEIVSAIS